MDLFDFIEDNAQKLNTNIAAVIIRDVLTGLAHCAQNHIVHRDIKPENILIQLRSNNLIVKLCDFGACLLAGHYPILRVSCVQFLACCMH